MVRNSPIESPQETAGRARPLHYLDLLFPWEAARKLRLRPPYPPRPVRELVLRLLAVQRSDLSAPARVYHVLDPDQPVPDDDLYLRMPAVEDDIDLAVPVEVVVPAAAYVERILNDSPLLIPVDLELRVGWTPALTPGPVGGHRQIPPVVRLEHGDLLLPLQRDQRVDGEVGFSPP
jgi:hypothetical protein